MKFTIPRGMGVFSKFVIVSGCFLLFVILPSQYYLLVNVRRNSCPPEGDRTSIFLGMRNAQNKQVDVEAYLVPEKAGTPDESTIFIVPRHKQPAFVPYVKVTNRNKFEALFRDHGSSNPLPDGLTDQDYLLKYDKRKKEFSPWENFYRDINRYQIYPFNSTTMMTSLMTYLQESHMSLCTQMGGGTQCKLNITFTDGGKGLMKPWRVPREYQTLPDHYFFADIERHTAELASFHLDRILDFRRVPPTTGRIFNITSEIRKCASGKDFVRSFFKSPANNTCFITKCRQYCEVSKTPVCGKPDAVEGSVAAFLPPYKECDVKWFKNPWKRSYTRGTGKAGWETNPNYCYSDVLPEPPYNRGRRLLDLMDLSIFDFFIGNFDRHSYQIFRKFGAFSTILHLDQGRAFGNYQKDELSCLAPLRQCCFLRNSTYHRLLLLNKDEYKLGDVMRESMSIDPIAPVLYEPHYEALNRRLRTVIDVIERCIANATSPKEVLKEEPLFEDYLNLLK